MATASGSYLDSAGHSETATDDDPSNYFGANPAIAINKVTVDGGIEGDGLSILTGEAISWKYIVSNTGNVALANVTVVDDMGTESVSDDKIVGSIDSLAAGASQTFNLIGTSGTGSYGNLATASGSYLDSAGHQVEASASDASSYFGANPAIEVEKYVSVDGGATWEDADSPAGPTLVNTSGINPQFKFIVTNTGNVGLSNVILDDPKLDLNGAEAGTAIAIGTMAAGQAYTTYRTGTWQAGQWTNTAFASGSYSDTAGHSKEVKAQDDANYFGALPGLVTNSSLCTFDSNSSIDGKQFNLVFTPDFSLASGNYKLSDSNPGQFYYNVFYNGAPGETKSFEFDIPDPFVTQGAVPVHAYSDVHIDQVGGMICLTPIGEIAGIKATDLKREDLNGDGIEGYAFTVKLPTSGFVYVNMHLDYGREKQTGWAKQTPIAGTDNAIDNANVSGIQPTINDNTSYTFSSNIIGSEDTVVNDNIFKNIKGVGGKTKLADTGDPLVNQSIILKDGSGKTVGSAKSDSDGWWFTNVNAPGKSSIYNAYWDKNNDGNVMSDPKQAITWGGPVKYVNVDFTQAALHLDSSDSLRPVDGVASRLSQDQLAPVVEAAKHYWSAQGVDISRLRNVDVLIGDLGGTKLGAADNDSLITLDDDAAGHGWSTSLGSVGSGKVDLFSAVSHEFGHILGYEHDVMGATLGIGERHLPFEADGALKNQFPLIAQYPSPF